MKHHGTILLVIFLAGTPPALAEDNRHYVSLIGGTISDQHTVGVLGVAVGYALPYRRRLFSLQVEYATAVSKGEENFQATHAGAYMVMRGRNSVYFTGSVGIANYLEREKSYVRSYRNTRTSVSGSIGMGIRLQHESTIEGEIKLLPQSEGDYITYPEMITARYIWSGHW